MTRTTRTRSAPKKGTAAAPEPTVAATTSRPDPFEGIPLVGIGLVLLIVFVLVTRSSQLDFRAFHHDESIHSYYSWGIADVKKGPGTYRYDPVYHGPFMYHFGAAFMRLFPDTN